MGNKEEKVIFVEVPIGGFGTSIMGKEMKIPVASAHMLEHLFFGKNSEVFECFTRNDILISANTKYYKTNFIMITFENPQMAKELFLEKMSKFNITHEMLENEKTIVKFEEKSEEKMINLYNIKHKELLCKIFGGEESYTITGTSNEIDQLECSSLKKLKEKYYCPAKVSFFCYGSPQNNVNNYTNQMLQKNIYYFDVDKKTAQNKLYKLLILDFAIEGIKYIDNYIFYLIVKQIVLCLLQKKYRKCQVYQKVDFIGNYLLYSMFFNINGDESFYINQLIEEIKKIREEDFEEAKKLVIKNCENSFFIMNKSMEIYYLLARMGVTDMELYIYMKSCMFDQFQRKLDAFFVKFESSNSLKEK